MAKSRKPKPKPVIRKAEPLFGLGAIHEAKRLVELLGGYDNAQRVIKAPWQTESSLNGQSNPRRQFRSGADSSRR